MLSVFIGSGVYAQDKSIELLEKANKVYNEGKFEEALNMYNNILFNHKSSEAFRFALFKKAEALDTLNEKVYAAQCYKEYLLEYYNKNKENWIIKDALDARFINSGYESAMKLGEYNYNNENYKEALYYYELIETSRLHHSSCGLGMFAAYHEIKILKAKCFEKLGRDAEAMEICKNEIITRLFSYDNENIELAIIIIDKNFSQYEIIAELNESLDNLYAQPYKHDNTKTRYYIKLFDREILVSDRSKKKHLEVESLERATEITQNSFLFKHYLASK
jgi:tetratricopeptide (TPR) repeat protein